MKSNFHLKSRRENQILHIHLHGLFDGASAFELIQTIADKEALVERIHVDTSRLTQALPFGRSVLDSHLPKNGLRPRLYFSGAWADSLLPEGCVLSRPHTAPGCGCSVACKTCSCRKTPEHQVY